MDLVDLGTLEFYAIRNQEGKWFREKGYGGSGATWVDDVKKARIWQRTAGARGVITWFATRFPTYGIPNLVKFTAQAVEIMDETERLAKREEAKKRRAANNQIWQAKQSLVLAQQEYEKAKRRLRMAGGTP